MPFNWQNILAKHAKLIVVATTTCTLLALIFALAKKDTWTATQGLLVRDEAMGDMPKPGRFESTDAMQTAQETILELSRFPTVVRPALLAVGPGKKLKKKTQWPSHDDIESLQEAINVSAPGGAQFGRTEMIYVTVKAGSVDRAVRLTNSVVDNLEKQLKSVRRQRYASIISELERTVKLAAEDLEVATQKIERVELTVGTNLVSLRDLTDNQSGEGSLVREFSELKRELRIVKARVANQEKLRRVLINGLSDPNVIVATPSSLLETQPSIRRLKDGLIDARIVTSRLAGIMKPDHPDLKAALKAEQEIRLHLYQELEVALRGLNSDVKVSRRAVAEIESHLASSQDNLLDVGKLRARYSNLRADVENKTKFLDQSRRDLAEARANQHSSDEVSLLTRIDTPIPSTRPVGPGKKTIILGGLFAGLAIAGGWVFLVEPIGVGTTGYPQVGYFVGPNRTNQSLANRYGRRASDQSIGADSSSAPERRATDALPLKHRSLLTDFVDHLTKNANESQTDDDAQSADDSHCPIEADETDQLNRSPARAS